MESVWIPLSEQVRPKNLEEFVGQAHLVGRGKPLWSFYEGKMKTSMVLYGPPGVGKTTFLKLFLQKTDLACQEFSAVTASITEVKEVIKVARKNYQAGGKPTLLLIDEFHRFNRLQQDAFLPSVEEGSILLVGLTTENPYFCLQKALLSRVKLFKFRPLEFSDLSQVVDRALESKAITLAEDLRKKLIAGAAGDARRLLGVLDLLLQMAEEEKKTDLGLEDFKALELEWLSHFHDRQGDSHYDMASALIKSIRGSDPDASLFWLTRMIQGGEDLMFLMRRLLILASEDIGNADPQALILAASARIAVEHVGPPEAHLILSHLVCYMAAAPKSNASYTALKKAEKHQASLNGPIAVPLHLRGASTRAGEVLPEGEAAPDYRYPHNFEGNWVAQNYWPQDMPPRRYYEPGTQGFEVRIQTWLKKVHES